MNDFVEILPRRTIVSPCVNICRIDQATQRCRGCARTTEEIARWTAMSAGERDRVMAALPSRKATPQAR
ncbi:MAG: DUF1289 domain-containing protein [Sphingomonas sp.]